MVRNNITRWSPTTCNCVVEILTVYDDNNENILEQPRFLLMNDVCEKHASMASTTHRAEHQQMATNVINFIEEAKAVNLGQVHHAMSRAKRRAHIRELNQCKAQVNQFNERITEEWNELISFPHAFDEHIYQQILKENQNVNG